MTPPPTPATTERFPQGTFATPSQPATALTMWTAQTRMEVSLFVRNGEQLLLALIIPIALLVGISVLGIGGVAEPRVASAFTAVAAVAIMSTAFTGQAIAVGFDRRYGALKRLGGTPLPRSIIVGGKVAAVVLIVAAQVVILGGIALALGWRPHVAGVIVALLPVLLGTMAFCALGLLLGGTLKAEITLAVANLLWFVLLGFSGLAIGVVDISALQHELLMLIPSYALTYGIGQALAGHFPLYACVVLAGWSVIGGAAATRYFSFT